ncbi:MAG: multiprotein bridging factor aMBF1 [Halobacteriaceae archaeon]
MVQCEMCGQETESPKTVKVEGAKLQVCADCTDFGTEVQTSESSSSSTKYSTSSEESTTSTSSSSQQQQSSQSRQQSTDLFDEMDEITPDYDQRIRNAREANDLSQADLADEINEKASLIRKLERGEILPSDNVQKKLERRLDISLTGSAGSEDEEWSTEGQGEGLTLGDMVERKE